MPKGFYLDYRDQQVSFVKLVGPSAVLVTENAGKSHAFGVELEGDYLATPNTRHRRCRSSICESRYDAFSYQTIAPPPASSTCAAIAPRAAASSASIAPATHRCVRRAGRSSGSAEQTIPLPNGGPLHRRGACALRSEVSGGRFVHSGRRRRTTRRAVDLGLSYVTPDDRFTVKAYVDNVTDEETISNATQNTSYAANGVMGINLQAPRTYGVRAAYRFLTMTNI